LLRPARGTPWPHMPKPKPSRPRPPAEPPAGPTNLRIIGGTFRGRKVAYSGDQRTRPMKERVREAVFNLLGDASRGKHAIDLFAGTGALGLEALSRGAARATFFEQHFPTVAILRENVAALDVANRVTIQPGNTFIWARRSIVIGPEPLLIFCSPPYEFYVKRCDEVLSLLVDLLAECPERSALVVECDERFDTSQLPDSAGWDVRTYPPAVVAIYRKRAAPTPADH